MRIHVKFTDAPDAPRTSIVRGGADTVIRPLRAEAGELFDPNTSSEWESDRAWLFAKPGLLTWDSETKRVARIVAVG